MRMYLPKIIHIEEKYIKKRVSKSQNKDIFTFFYESVYWPGNIFPFACKSICCPFKVFVYRKKKSVEINCFLFFGYYFSFYFWKCMAFKSKELRYEVSLKKQTRNGEYKST